MEGKGRRGYWHLLCENTTDILSSKVRKYVLRTLLIALLQIPISFQPLQALKNGCFTYVVEAEIIKKTLSQE